MNNQPPCFVHAVRETAPKNEDVDPPLDLGEHQTADRRTPPSLLLQLKVFLLLLPLCEFLEGSQVTRSLPELFSRTDVGKGFGEVPPLKDLFIDVVAVVGAHDRFGRPPLLEEGFAGIFKGYFFRLFTNGAEPEVVQVARRPALQLGCKHACGVCGKRTMRGRARLRQKTFGSRMTE